MMPKRLTKSAASEVARALGSLSARKAGLASAAALTEEQRKEKARKAIAARWGKVKRPKGQELPIDQRQVMRRLEDKDQVTLRIAQGSNGTRRLRAISRLEANGVIHVVTLTGKDVTIARGARPYKTTPFRFDILTPVSMIIPVGGGTPKCRRTR